MTPTTARKQLISLFFALFLAISMHPKLLYSAPASTIEAATIQISNQMDLMLFRINMFHHEAKMSLISTLELPFFKEYFSLPESKFNRYNEEGVIQFSPKQINLQKRISEWTATLHKRFPIGEACLIDQYGQEHFRAVSGKTEGSHLYSDEESDAPFFKPTIALEQGKVTISEPYMSPDSYHWVVAFTSPIVLPDGKKPAFFHFEVPMSVYQTILKTKDFGFTRQEKDPELDINEEGIYFIVDQNGLLIADNHQDIKCAINPLRHPEKNPNLPDYLPPEKSEDYFPNVTTISSNPHFLKIVKRMQKGESDLETLHIEGRDYILMFQPVPDHPWSLGHLDPVGGPGFWVK